MKKDQVATISREPMSPTSEWPIGMRPWWKNWNTFCMEKNESHKQSMEFYYAHEHLQWSWLSYTNRYTFLKFTFQFLCVFHISKLSFELFINCNGVQCSRSNNQIFYPVQWYTCHVEFMCSKKSVFKKCWRNEAILFECKPFRAAQKLIILFWENSSISDFQLHDDSLA